MYSRQETKDSKKKMSKGHHGHDSSLSSANQKRQKTSHSSSEDHIHTSSNNKHNNSHGHHHHSNQQHHNRSQDRTHDDKKVKKTGGGSTISTTSNTFNPNNASGSHRHEQQSSAAASSGNKGQSNHPLTPVYEALLHARKIITSLELTSYYQELSPAIHTLLGLAASTILSSSSSSSKQQQLHPQLQGMDLTDCIQAFQALRSFHSTITSSSYRNHHPLIVKATILLDDCYYTLYYCLELHSRMKNSGKGHSGGGNGGEGDSDDRHSKRLPVPPPHIYFTMAITSSPGCKELLSTMFQTYLRRNITSADGIDRLKQIWGFDILTNNSYQTLQLSPFNKKNPLLQVHFTRWKESLCFLSLLELIPQEHEVMIMLQSLQSQVLTSPTQATMKGTDPLLPSIIREYNDSCRIWPCRLYAFATPNQQAIQRLISLAPIVEIGAGTGYWSHMIRSCSPTSTLVHCYDKDPPCPQQKVKLNDYHGRSKAWTNVMKGGPEVVTSLSTTCTLFLCYPPPDSPMALLSLRAYTGNCVCYVGEWQGDTGTKAFEKLLCETFSCEEIIPLPNWGDTCYMMMVWKRRVSGGAGGVSKDLYSNHQTFPVLCSACGNKGNTSTALVPGGSSSLVPSSTSLPLQRCRLSYNISFCNSTCAIAGRDRHIEELSMKYLLQRDTSSSATVTADVESEKEKIVETKQSGNNKKRKRDIPTNSAAAITTTAVGKTSNAYTTSLIELTPSHFVRIQSPRYLLHK